MYGRYAFACAVVFAAGVLLAGSASAQWHGPVTVAGVEPGPIGPISVGVSAARCGDNVVVGFGDAEQGNRRSFGGYAVSSNGGASFRDLGVLPVSTVDSGYGTDVLGAPVDYDVDTYNFSLACASPSLFYYAAIYQDNNEPPGTCDPLCDAISVSISRNGGTSWELPVLAARADFDNHQLNSLSIAVDPSNTSRIYIAYSDLNGQPFDFNFADCPGGNTIQVLRVASSADGGMTWTLTNLDHVCDASVNPEEGGNLATPRVLVSSSGTVYVSYEFQAYQNGPVPNEIRFTQSLDHGTTFSTPMVVSTDAILNARPAMAVDRSNTTQRGTIYLTWSGSPTGTYTDVLVSESTNSGASFSFPRSISPAPAPGTERFQRDPVIAVDNDGQVADCFYDTSTNNPTGSSVYSYNCATSFNHAATWQMQRLARSAPKALDAVASDFLLHSDGFFTSYELQAGNRTEVVGQRADQN